MTKLSRKEIEEIEAIEREDVVRNWEELFGVDDPGYLPYWIAYMPEKKRIAYLQATKSEFLDFSADMLHKDFDWTAWSIYDGEYSEYYDWKLTHPGRSKQD